MKAVLTGPWGDKTNVEIIKSFWKNGAELRTIKFNNGLTADVHLRSHLRSRPRHLLIG